MAVYPTDIQVTLDLDIHPLSLGRSTPDPRSPPILHSTVSRSHFQVEWCPRTNTHIGKDLSSRNGSKLNGRPIGTAGWYRLRNHDVLRIGDVIFVYETHQTFEIRDSSVVSREALPGNAQCIRQLRTRVAHAAADISPILIIGETGTGKEQLASEIHRLSGRSGPFVAVNCATFGKQLIESQLFGHLRGAFTGASTDQPGLFRAAHQGTLFLDEIGEMPLELQPRLLRAIQEGEIRPLGSAETTKVNTRIIAATHKNLPQAVKQSEFRQDLYGRLALWQLHLPAIRHRRVDILFWIRRLHERWMAARSLIGPQISWTPDAAQRLLLAPWTENLRGIDRLVHTLATEQGIPPAYLSSIDDTHIDEAYPPRDRSSPTTDEAGEPHLVPPPHQSSTAGSVRFDAESQTNCPPWDINDLPCWIDEVPG
ncbi:MAG: sigma-54-dependent Fis family transcriptional regulator [Myxococcales bacterium]|nr:sigma-54-dependent Fis family transcriptional regulator [Myxococcales bacterium]